MERIGGIHDFAPAKRATVNVSDNGKRTLPNRADAIAKRDPQDRSTERSQAASKFVTEVTIGKLYRDLAVGRDSQAIGAYLDSLRASGHSAAFIMAETERIANAMTFAKPDDRSAASAYRDASKSLLRQPGQDDDRAPVKAQTEASKQIAAPLKAPIVGQTVNHPTFGRGTVESLDMEKNRIAIRFGDQSRTLSLSVVCPILT